MPKFRAMELELKGMIEGAARPQSRAGRPGKLGRLRTLNMRWRAATVAGGERHRAPTREPGTHREVRLVCRKRQGWLPSRPWVEGGKQTGENQGKPGRRALPGPRGWGGKHLVQIVSGGGPIREDAGSLSPGAGSPQEAPSGVLVSERHPASRPAKSPGGNDA
jgi:hypothetical protein